MSNKKTIKALDDLVKTENMAIAALDAAIDEVDDKKLRKAYSKFRDSHMKQAEALNARIEDLGGDPVEYEVGAGKGQATLWGRLTGMNDDTSLAGMRLGAERGIKRYVDNLDEIDDPKSLNIIRKNLEAKQDEIEWYDDQMQKDRSEKLDTKLEVSKDKAEEIMKNGKNDKKGGLPFPLIVVAGAIGAAAFFLLRRGDDSDYDDYGEDAFRYEGDEGAAESGYTSAGSYNAGEGSTDYGNSMNYAGDSGAQS